MPKFKQIFDLMILQNQDLFNKFKKIHDSYSKNPNKFKQQFDEAGKEVLFVISRYESRLCGKSENSGFGNFSTSLSEKFWQEVRTVLPKIDDIGLK